MPDVPDLLRPTDVGVGDAVRSDRTVDGPSNAGAPIAQDISAHLTIGTGDDATAHDLISASYESSRYDEAALLKASIIADSYPEQGTTMTLHINGTTLASAHVDESTPKDDGSVQVVGYDGIRPLLQTTIDGSYRGPIRETANAIYDEAGVDGEVAIVWDELQAALNFDGVNAYEALSRLATEVNGIAYADPTAPGGPPLLTDSPDIGQYDISMILKAKAGLQTKPFDRVVLTGIGGIDTATQTPKRPITAEAGADTGRTFRKTYADIGDQQRLTRVAQALMAEFDRQQRRGDITLVGDERIQPLDVVTMPDSLGGTPYLVSTVKHTLDADDGYKTVVGVGSVIESDDGTPTSGHGLKGDPATGHPATPLAEGG